jgi:hypothetical protein
MSRGKYLSLEEAQKEGKIDRFAAEHPSTGDEDKFEAALRLMAGGKPEAEGPSSDEAESGDCA